jgi:flagellar motor protein MotB
VGQAVERELPVDGVFGQRVQDENIYLENRGDRVEVQQVVETEARTVKLHNVVPPIPFDSGEAEIPGHYVGLLREALERVKERRNVRLHFVGHTDSVPLYGEARAKYGDNLGLSRERAGVVAEFFKDALALPAEAISYDGMGESQPVASNQTEAGRAKNRRVEVEVWYDEVDEKQVQKEVLVAQQLTRVKVCRVETVCKLRYRAGHEKRARIRNLLPPLRFDDETGGVPPEYQQKVLQALRNLEGKQNVVVRFVGHTDNTPLEGRDARIYGNHLALSKARARRVALAVQDGLKLPSHAVESDGRGSRHPVASNDTSTSRALNRRVEVEFWYDDPLQELPDEPQLCPEASGAETVTRVYEPPSGPIAPIHFQNGRPVIPVGYVERLAQLMGEVQDKANVRLRFIGYTANERLDRRTAMVYGDDIGLSTARARRAMEQVRTHLDLTNEQVEHEGRGYVQSADVVNAGFVTSHTSRVDVQVVYDELAALDDSDALEITRLTREVSPANPFALNLMRISVDGKPIDDPGKSIQDVQRCTDVAFERADIQFKFDNLALKPRLNVSAWPHTVRYQDDPETEVPDSLVRFRAWSNYPAFIARSELRIFAAEQSTRDEPHAVVPLSRQGTAEWQAQFDVHPAPRRELKYVLRVYDAAGHFDETAPQPLWLVEQRAETSFEVEPDAELLTGYGENRLAVQNIPLRGGSLHVYGTGIPAGHTVWVAGEPVPLGKDRNFVAEAILPEGLHTVEVAVLDGAGNGELFLRDLELKKIDWFYVGIADVTVSQSDTNGPAQLVTNDKAHYDNDLTVDGRLAGYVHGKFGNDWQLTASADTLEGPVEDLFTDFMDKSPDALFRRIDPDYFYPTYGDDSTVEEGAPTLGKFYLKLQQRQNYGLWGNFRIGYVDNSLAHVDRGLYGANLHYESDTTTSFGEKRFWIDGFAAQPGTVAGRDEFRGTGGSLYYLRHQDIVIGSERVRVEVRDKDSGLVTAVKNLAAGLDYSIDYLQGRIVLAQPLSGVAGDDLLVDSGGGAGNEVYLVARYEFAPGFDDMDNLSNGGRAHYWFGDHVRLGLTANQSEEAGEASDLHGADLIVRKNAQTWVKVETSRSEGPGVATLQSADGGFTFDGTQDVVSPDTSAGAYRVDTRIGLSDLHPAASGTATLYKQYVEAGYSAPGVATLKDTDQYGGTLDMPVTDRLGLKIKGDRKVQTHGLETAAGELDLDYRLDQHWIVSTGVRNDYRKDRSPVVPLTQLEGERTDMVLRTTFDSRARWLAFGYIQDTVNTTGNRETNGRVGTGGSYRLTDRFTLTGEASTGDLGAAGRLGAEYLYTDRTTIYTNYALENERTDNGVRARKGNLVSGFRSHWTDTTSVFLEERYSHGDVPTGLTHATGVDLAPDDRWNFGISADFGTLRDNLTAAEIERRAVGARIGYAFDAVRFSSALEYRVDKTEATDLSTSERTTWLTKNSLKYQLSPDWRFIGKLDHAQSESSLGEFYDGSYTEAVAGYGYRPVAHDRLNALVKYTYFYNLPSPGQVTVENTAAEFIQKSHIFAADVIYDLSPRWSVGGKYAYRLGQVAQDREDPEFFDSRAHLYIGRVDWHFIHRWDAVFEARMLDLPDARDRRSGTLVAVYRHFGDHLKAGAGYNFTNFSDDLTDLDYDNLGFFINIVGSI